MIQLHLVDLCHLAIQLAQKVHWDPHHQQVQRFLCLLLVHLAQMVPDLLAALHFQGYLGHLEAQVDQKVPENL